MPRIGWHLQRQSRFRIQRRLTAYKFRDRRRSVTNRVTAASGWGVRGAKPLGDRIDWPKVRILSFTGGAGTMYCGSCLRDNALAAELLARGHDVVLTPVYTPTRTDERNVSQGQVFLGGISVYLEQHSVIFRHTPRFLDRLWDAEWVIRMATNRQVKVDPQSLGELTVSMLRGE